MRLRIIRTSSAGATGTSFTPIKPRPDSPASVTTCNVKNGTSAFTVGTLVTEHSDVVRNTRAIYDWVARDGEDVISSGTNERIAIAIRVGVASHDLAVEADWEE